MGKDYFLIKGILELIDVMSMINLFNATSHSFINKTAVILGLITDRPIFMVFTGL